MATPLGRRLLVIATLAAMVAALVLLAAFTWRYAAQLALPRLALCLLALLGIIGLTWAIVAQRVRGLHAPKYSGKRIWVLKPSAPYVALLFATAMIGWMFYAHLLDPSDPSYRVHWIVQLLLLITGAALIYWRFSEMRGGTTKEDEFVVEENTRKREKVLEDMKALAQSSWFSQFATGTTGARLRASLNWWIEEYELAVPANGFVMAENFINHFLEDARRQVTFIDDLKTRNDQREDMLQEAERRMLEFINRTGRLVHRT
jgi:MFS family permease